MEKYRKKPIAFDVFKKRERIIQKYLHGTPFTRWLRQKTRQKASKWNAQQIYRTLKMKLNKIEINRTGFNGNEWQFL